MISLAAGTGARVRTARRGWLPLGPSLPPPPVGESSTLALAGLPPGARLTVGPLVLQADADGHAELRLIASDLAGHVGLLALTIEGLPAGEIEVVPEKLTGEAYRLLRAELEATWGRLAFAEEGVTAEPARAAGAAELWRRIAASVEGIRRAPRALLVRATTFGRLDQVRLAGSLSPGLLRAALGGGSGLVDQLVPTVDVPENRLAREVLVRLARVAGRQPGAAGVADTVAGYLRAPPFCGLSPLTGPPRPTHGMLRDPRYRVVWEVMSALQGSTAAAVETPAELRVGLRALPRLYEYWVFLQVLQAAARRYGPPLGAGWGAVARRVDRLRARVEIVAGTTVEFPGQVRVAFEPAFRPRGHRDPSWGGLELVPHPDPDQMAFLATPDVVVAIGDAPPRLLVIDAKYVARAFVEREAAVVHTRYGRLRYPGLPQGVVERVLVAHPHPGLASSWAGYGHLPFVPGAPLPELPWPG